MRPAVRMLLEQSRRRLAERAGVDLLRQGVDPACWRSSWTAVTTRLPQVGERARHDRLRGGERHRISVQRRRQPQDVGACRAVAVHSSAPCRAGGPVLQHDAFRLQFVANPVGGRRSRDWPWPRPARRCGLRCAAIALALEPIRSRQAFEQAQASRAAPCSHRRILDPPTDATARSGVLRSSQHRLEHACDRARPARRFPDRPIKTVQRRLCSAR